MKTAGVYMLASDLLSLVLQLLYFRVFVEFFGRVFNLNGMHTECRETPYDYIFYLSATILRIVE